MTSDKPPYPKKADVSLSKLEQAFVFLEENPFGKRLMAAEHCLALLLDNQLPLLRQFVFTSRFELNNRQAMESRHIRVALEDDAIRFQLFYDSDLNQNESNLFSRALSEVAAVTYAAIGLDMSGFVSVKEQITSQ